MNYCSVSILHVLNICGGTKLDSINGFKPFVFIVRDFRSQELNPDQLILSFVCWCTTSYSWTILVKKH